MQIIKFATRTLIILFILFSSCVILRKKELKRSFVYLDTNPKNYCFTVKTNINYFLSVKAKIANETADQNFMFDTGSPLTYKFKTKDSFNIASKKWFKYGSYKVDFGTGSINFGNVAFNNIGYLVTDHILSEYEGVDGIIGSSILKTSICELNFVDSTIKVSNDLKNFTNIENCYSITFDPFELQATPVVKIIIGKDTLTAFIDTGFPGIVRLNGKVKIPNEVANKEETFRNVRYFGYPKKDYFINTNYYNINMFEIAGIKIDSTLIGQDPKYYGRNCVGLAFLKKFIVTIDWIHNRIYFKPVKEFSFKQSYYSYGFTCYKYDKQLRVYEIYKGSEAEKAGIKSGDVIISVNFKTNVTDAMVATINSNKADNDIIQIEIKDKPMLTLKKYKLFN